MTRRPITAEAADRAVMALERILEAPDAEEYLHGTEARDQLAKALNILHSVYMVAPSRRRARR